MRAQRKKVPSTRKKDDMSEEAIRIATEYLRRISGMYESSVLKILYAYAEKSGAKLP